MLKQTLLSFILVSYMSLSAQTLRMTFTPSGVSDKVDSVKATNLRTNQHVTLPGNDTLYLAVNTGIDHISGLTGQGLIFPNPCQGKTTLVANVRSAQTVAVVVYDLAGRVAGRALAFVQPGSHAFAISLSRRGTYMVSLSTDIGKTGFKIICTECRNHPG
ncbi:MAG: T9SS type A sorting domain-containing protein [Bacteroidetes bacterium]|nr:T9SS type A sorting domain-containing protein [Bacteroidota bacterium]